MLYIIAVLTFASIFSSCTPKKDAPMEEIKQDVRLKSIPTNTFQLENEFLDYLRFSGNVETEIFKIVDSKFKSTGKIPSQLRILSQLLDSKLSKSPSKQSGAIFYNCYKISIQNKSSDEIEVLKNCEKKAQIIARVKKSGENLYQISFIQSEWQSVIGDSAMLNLKDKVCDLVISNKKVHELSCKNTLITVGTGTELEEIKLHQFKFDRDSKNQIEITGGRFKDFLERSQINILVPEEGKIKFREEEILVRDDYAEPPPTPSKEK